MATRWDAEQADLLDDWQKQDDADKQARDDKLKSIDAQRDHGVQAAENKHEAKLREVSPESELYAGQRDLADKEYADELKGVHETHAKETTAVQKEYDQKHDANSRARESLQTRLEQEPEEEEEAAEEEAPQQAQASAADERSAVDQQLDADFGADPVPPPPERKNDDAATKSEDAAKEEDETLKH
jgi:hypothetical protein